jgi:hypothetical protein
LKKEKQDARIQESRNQESRDKMQELKNQDARCKKQDKTEAPIDRSCLVFFLILAS